MSANWWTEPMPTGWQAKWDQAQNRYFFIDHSTKKTSWVDPRSPEGRYQVRAPPQAHNARDFYGGAAIPMQPVGIYCSKCHKTKVARQGQVCVSCTAQSSQRKCAKCRVNQVKQQGDTCTQCMLKRLLEVEETSFNDDNASASRPQPSTLSVRADPNLIIKLKESYPDAFDSHIHAALESNNNVESKAKLDLERRGYKKVSQQDIKAEKLMQKLKPKYPECPDDILKTTIKSCDCVEFTTTKKLKELGFLTMEEKKAQEKAEREAKEKRVAVERTIRKSFPSVSNDVIQMALDSTNYDQRKASDLLNAMTSQSGAKATAKLPTSNAASASKIAADKGKQPARSPMTPETSGAKPAAPKNKPAAAVTKPAATVTKPAAAVTKATPQKVSRPKVAQTKPRQNVPSLSKLAHGPNLALPKGPQDGLLLKGYCEVVGPNLAAVQGPTCRVAGTQGAIGPDKGLVHGPAAIRV